jgi:hypothetical protein
MALDAAHGEMSFGFGASAGANKCKVGAVSDRHAPSHCARDLAEGEAVDGVREVGAPAGGAGGVGPFGWD